MGLDENTFVEADTQIVADNAAFGGIIILNPGVVLTVHGYHERIPFLDQPAALNHSVLAADVNTTAAVAHRALAHHTVFPIDNEAQ